MEIQKDEQVVFEVQNRYDFICRIMDWSPDGRHIGRLLIQNPDGMSVKSIARTTGIPRATVRRRIDQLIGFRCVERIDELVRYITIGRALHIALHREICRVAVGGQKGLSKPLIKALAMVPGVDAKRLSDASLVSYAEDLPEKMVLDFSFGPGTAG